MNSIAILITEETRPMIAALNGGVAPEVAAEATYFICDFENNVPVNQAILAPLVFRERRSDFELMNDFYVSK